MSNPNYTQCLLRKPTSKGYTERVAFIPTTLAKIGKVVEVKVDDSWDNGWTVTKTYATVSWDYLQPRERDYLSQRSASDV